MSDIKTLFYVTILYGLWELVARKNWRAILWIAIWALILHYSLSPIRNIFKIPAIYGKAQYGFPSGHLYWFSSLYGWMAFMLNRTLIHRIFKDAVWGIYLLGLGIICTYTVERGYHTWTDVLGGIVFGWSLLWIMLMGVTRWPHIFLGERAENAF